MTAIELGLIAELLQFCRYSHLCLNVHMSIDMKSIRNSLKFIAQFATQATKKTLFLVKARKAEFILCAFIGLVFSTDTEVGMGGKGLNFREKTATIFIKQPCFSI